MLNEPDQSEAPFASPGSNHRKISATPLRTIAQQ